MENSELVCDNAALDHRPRLEFTGTHVCDPRSGVTCVLPAELKGHAGW